MNKHQVTLYAPLWDALQEIKDTARANGVPKTTAAVLADAVQTYLNAKDFDKGARG